MNDSKELQNNHSHHGEEHAGPSRETLLRQLGERLRNARQHRDISLDEAVHALKLRRVYVEALENGEWESLPGEVYALGFLRQYSAFLDLNLDEDIRHLRSEEYELTRPETFPDPPIAPKKSWVIVAALVLLVLFVVFNIFNNSDETPTPAPKIEAPATAESDAQPTPPEEVAPPQETQQSERDVASPPSVENEDTASTPSATAALHTYRFEAVGGDAWLQLYTVGDSPELIREVLLHAGETMTITRSDAELSITCGNPPVLAVYVDDKLLIAPGKLGSQPGKVIRDYRLSLTSN